MNILALVPDAYGGRGGIAQFTRDTLSAIASSSHVKSVTVLSRHNPDAITDIPAKIVVDNCSAGSKHRFVGRVVSTILRGRYDLVLCAHINLLPLAFLAARARNASLVLLIYGIEAWRPRGHAFGWFVRHVTKVYSISSFTLERFDEWAAVPASRCGIIPCTVDLERFRPGPRSNILLEKYGLTESRVLLTVARLADRERYKGIDETIEALPHLAREFPNIRYLIVGEGPDRIRLEQRAVALGVSSRVVFAGYVQDADKVAHYQLADVFTMPGRGEGFGIVFLEALACGLPVIASVLDASREAVLYGQLGQVVDPREPAEVLTALRRALNEGRRTVQPPALLAFSQPNFDSRWRDEIEMLSPETTL